MSTKTLASLALLKVTVDTGGDYLHYLRPFVLHVLNRAEDSAFSPESVARHIRHEFGMAIPPSIIKVVLRRIARHHKLRAVDAGYERMGPLPDPKLQSRQAAAHRQIDTVVSDLSEFANSTPHPLASRESAVKAICTFLSHFDISCLRMYRRGTALPSIDSPSDTDVVLVSEYVNHIHRTSATKFESFLVLVQGHMLANALTCSDLGTAPQTYKRTRFFLDTPFVTRLLGAEGPERHASSQELVRLVTQLGGKFAVFAHSCDELGHVFSNAARFVDRPDGRGGIVAAAKRGLISTSDLILLSETFEDRLHSMSIQTQPTPEFPVRTRIDESDLEGRLRNEIPYSNPNAVLYDVKSVQSIYSLRRNAHPRTIETARAVLVTSNTRFASVAWAYGREVEETLEVSTVITDFTLANTAWLKAPVGAPDVPITQVLAFSYAALQPSEELLDRFLVEVDRLRDRGDLSVRDHQLLRSRTHVEDDVVDLTLGDVNAITESVVAAARDRAVEEIKREQEESLLQKQEALDQEQADHQATQLRLETETQERRRILKSVYWSSRKTASIVAWLFSCTTMAVVAAVGSIAISSVVFGELRTDWLVFAAIVVVEMFTISSILSGSKLHRVHERALEKVHGILLRKEAARMGVDFGDFG